MVAFVAGLLFVSGIATAVPVVLDFETDDGGTALINGQVIDTFTGPGTLEFGNIVDQYCPVISQIRTDVNGTVVPYPLL